jgi:hypothetical protein
VGAAVGHHRHDDAAGGEVTGEAWAPWPRSPVSSRPCSPPRPLAHLVQIKCDQYWPNRGTETYGFIQVTLLDTIELATFCVRTFSLHKVGPAGPVSSPRLTLLSWRGKLRFQPRQDRAGVDPNLAMNPCPFLQSNPGFSRASPSLTDGWGP